MDGKPLPRDDIEATIGDHRWPGRAIAVPDDITEQLRAIIESRRRTAGGRLRSVKRVVLAPRYRSQQPQPIPALVSPGFGPHHHQRARSGGSACVERYRSDAFSLTLSVVKPTFATNDHLVTNITYKFRRGVTPASRDVSSATRSYSNWRTGQEPLRTVSPIGSTDRNASAAHLALEPSPRLRSRVVPGTTRRANVVAFGMFPGDFALQKHARDSERAARSARCRRKRRPRSGPRCSRSASAHYTVGSYLTRRLRRGIP